MIDFHDTECAGFIDKICDSCDPVDSWMVFADWLDDRMHEAVANKIRFWYGVAYSKAISEWRRGLEPSSTRQNLRRFVSKFNLFKGHSLPASVRLEMMGGGWSKLAIILLQRVVESSHPPNYSDISDWPSGWNADLFSTSIQRLRAYCELSAFGIISDFSSAIPSDWNPVYWNKKFSYWDPRLPCESSQAMRDVQSLALSCIAATGMFDYFFPNTYEAIARMQGYYVSSQGGHVYSDVHRITFDSFLNSCNFMYESIIETIAAQSRPS